jgi:acyl-CoA synthetase (AMP-forming)/AMP-acid ligase II
MYPGIHALENPDKPAHIMAESGEVVSYRELNDRSNRLAQLLYQSGLREGDHVAIFMENHPRYPEIYWAALRSGLYLTCVNRFLTADEAAYLIGDCGANALITSHELRDVALEMLPSILDCNIRLMVDGTTDGYQSYEEAVSRQPADVLQLGNHRSPQRDQAPAEW